MTIRVIYLFLFFVQSNRSLPFETKFHVLLSLRGLLEGWTILGPLSYKIKTKKVQQVRTLKYDHKLVFFFCKEQQKKD